MVHRLSLFLAGAALAAISGQSCKGGAPPTKAPASSTNAAPPRAGGQGLDPDLRAQLGDGYLAGGPRTAWYGVYMMDKKVGHARVVFRQAAEEEAGAWVASSDAVISVGALTMTMQETRHYADTAGGPLVESSFLMDNPSATDRRRLIATPDGVTLERTLGDTVQPTRTGPPTKDSLETMLRTQPLTSKGLVLGQSARVAVWDWSREADDWVTVTVKEVQQRRRSGVSMDVAVLELAYEALKVQAISYVGPDGVPLETQLGPGMVLRLEDEDVAKGGVVGLDILGSAVKVARPIGDPRTVQGLVLDVTLPAAAELPTADNQRVAPRQGGAAGDQAVRVTLSQAPGEAVTEAAEAEALVTDATFDWKSPEVLRMASKLTQGAAGRAEKVAALADFVYRTLEKRLATHLPSASMILDKKVGDCTEHTWLFVALARAAGVPARPVYGVAYTGDAEQAFAYHAWVEVALHGRWVPIDPTWNEAVADATHLKLGSELGPMSGLMGGLTLEVVEVTRAAPEAP